MAALDSVLPRQQPDWVLVYGDTNSTLAAALSTVKLNLPLAHLEAGLRSFNRRMPEEHNRVLSDHAADLLLAPSEMALEHLRTEGLGDRSVLVGDVMTDALFQVKSRVEGKAPAIIQELRLGAKDFYLATVHRAENTNDPKRLGLVIDALAGLDKPVVLLAHPRVVAKAHEYGICLNRQTLIQHPPLAYPDLIAAVMASAGVVTDSGGLQKEAFLLRVPCTTMRSETEWAETLELGWNVLANTCDEIRAAVTRPEPLPTTATPYGDGHAADRAVDTLLGWTV